MNRLTPFAKILILLLVGVALYFGIMHFFGDQIQGIANDTTETTETNDSDASTAKSNTSSASETASFNYNPPKPIGGKLMGVVELGAAGFNSFIIKKDSDDNWEKVKYEWGNSLVADGLANGDDVRMGLKKFISQILDYGVAGKDIHFVVSSGASKEPAIPPIVTELKNLGYVVNEVTPEQEGEYALKCVLPKAYENRAFVVDIGSGNTKVSWIQNGRVSARESYGAKYYQRSVSDSEAYNDAKSIGREIPKNLTNTCFIIGGVPFNMASESRNGDERFTVLEDPSGYTSLTEEKGEKVQSGLNIYQGMKDGSGCDNFVFDWDANFTIGFLLSLPG